MQNATEAIKEERQMKMTVLYHSKTGYTKQMAEVIAEGMQTVDAWKPNSFPSKK